METSTTLRQRSRRLLVALAALAVAGSCSSQQPAPDEPSDGLVGSPAQAPSLAPAPEPDRSGDDSPRRSGALWYRLEVHRGELTATVRLLNPAERTSFFLPGAGSGRKIAQGAIAIQGARAPGRSVPVNQLPDEGRIDLPTDGLDWVELDYRVDLDAFPAVPGRPRPRYANRTLLAYGPDIFVVPSKSVADEIRDIPVEIHAPKDWSLLATWRARARKDSHDTDDRVHGFVARNLRLLRDAFFVAGPHIESVHRAEGDSSLTVAFGGGVGDGHRRLTSIVEKTVGAYRRRFGSTGPVLAFFHAGSDQDVSVRGTAKRNGFVVGTDDADEIDTETELLVAHEAFHLWNGHELIPHPSDASNTRWFKEGTTHYVAIKTLYAAGLFSFGDVRRELARSAYYYRRNPASRGRRASRLDLHRLPYDRGLLLALAFDGALAGCSGGERTIADWLTHLLDEGRRFYDVETLRTSFQATAGGDCRAGRRIWARHVLRESPLDPSQILANLDLHFLEASTLEETKVLPLEGDRRRFERLFSTYSSESSGPRVSETRSASSTPPTPPDRSHE